MTILILFLYGLVFGSFINALIWRVKNKKNWVSERSICPNCKKELKLQHLVPVFSWIWLKGKCAYCKKPISVQYPAVELLTGLVFAVSYVAWLNEFFGLEVAIFALWLVISVVLVALTVYDLKWMLLPNSFVLVLTLLSIFLVLLSAYSQRNWVVIIDSIGGAVVLFGIFWCLFQVSKGTWIGGGDVKLAVPLGLIVGSPLLAFLVLFGASILGSIIAIPLLILKRAKVKTQLPFGPFLILATFLVFFWGQQFLNWYSNLLYL